MSDLYKQLREEKFLIAGPCVIESEKMVLNIAQEVKKITEKLGLKYIFKASFDKANRTSVSSFRGMGIDEGLRILQRVKTDFGLDITTDIHESSHVSAVGEVVDILQIPAFLCRQTDLLAAAAKTGKIVNIKKAQFLAGLSMEYPANKVKESGNSQIMLTERGSSFGYGNLVVDFTGILDMQNFGFPIIMDCTHSVQKPSTGGTTGGNRKYAPYMAKLANSIGVKGFFFETHPSPDDALSDGPNMVKLSEFEEVVKNNIMV